MSTRREFLKQASAIAASVGLGPEQLMQAEAVTNALRAITTGDLSSLAGLLSQRQATESLKKQVTGGLLRHINVPSAFAGEPGDTDEKRAARYLASLATREQIIDVVAEAQAQKSAQEIILNNLSGGFTRAINGFLNTDSDFAQAVHQLSCKIGKLAMDKFRTTLPVEKLTLPTVEEMREKHPDRKLAPDECAFITERHQRAQHFLAMQDGNATLQQMQEAVANIYHMMSEPHMTFSEIVDNIFGVESIYYTNTPPADIALQSQMQQWVDELVAHTDCNTIGAGQKRLITELLKDHKFWTAFDSENLNMFTHATGNTNMEIGLLHNIQDLIGKEAAKNWWNMATRKVDYFGQFEFRVDILESLSRHPALPSEYRQQLEHQAEAESQRIRRPRSAKDAGRISQAQQDTPKPPRTQVKSSEPHISPDSQQMYDAMQAPGAFARDHSWFERLLDEKNHAKPLDHLKTASR